MNQKIKDISTGTWLSIATVLLQLIMGIVAAVWMVSQITGTSSQLQYSIHGLSGSVEKLNNTVTSIQAEQFEHAARIRVIEDRMQRGSR